MKHILALALAGASFAAGAQSAISPTNHYAWAGNAGWLDFRAERPNPGDGFVFGEFSCAGWLWSPNLGWIDCGDGSPADGISYGNNNTTDYGVNHYGTGDLYGLAWAPNAGWINFGWWALETTNAARPHVDLITGQFSGYAWSANCGWINLAGQLKTDRMKIIDTDGDGISDAFEIAYTGSLTNMTATSDLDGDGITDKNEYLLLSNPLGTNAPLRITRITKLNGVKAVEMEWPSSPARVYSLEAETNDLAGNWLFLADVLGAPGGSTTVAVEQGPPTAFFRIAAKVPLQP